MGRMVMNARWLFVPMVMLAAIGLCAMRLSWRERFFPLTAMLLLGVLLFQTQGIVEGRYRLPVEPYLVASLCIFYYKMLFANQKNKARTSHNVL
jgi:nicotinamide riboside transporter PnuC